VLFFVIMCLVTSPQHPQRLHRRNKCKNKARTQVATAIISTAEQIAAYVNPGNRTEASASTHTFLLMLLRTAAGTPLVTLQDTTWLTSTIVTLATKHGGGGAAVPSTSGATAVADALRTVNAKIADSAELSKKSGDSLASLTQFAKAGHAADFQFSEHASALRQGDITIDEYRCEPAPLPGSVPRFGGLGMAVVLI
jgi:hypothetical protein